MEEDHLDSRSYLLSSSLPSSLPSPSSTNCLWVHSTRLGKVGRRGADIGSKERGQWYVMVMVTVKVVKAYKLGALFGMTD